MELQRDESDTVLNLFHQALKQFFHFIAVVHFCYGLSYDYILNNNCRWESDMYTPFGGKFKYLTFLNANIQNVFYIISLLNDIFGTNEVAPRNLPAIRILKDYLMATLAFPLTFIVSITFWTIYAVDRELVFPRIMDDIFPKWLNHMMHTNIVVFMVLEMFVTFHSYPPRITGLTGLSAFLVTYLIWIHIIKYYTNIWVYPVFGIMQNPVRGIFFAAMLIFTLCLYLFGEFLNNMIWAKELELEQQKED